MNASIQCLTIFLFESQIHNKLYILPGERSGILIFTAINIFSRGASLIFSAELKPPGNYLEHGFYLDHVIFTNMSHVYYLDQ